MTSLEPPEIIIVYSGDTNVGYAKGEEGYDKVYNLLKGTHFTNVLERAIDQDFNLNTGNYIVFRYNQPQYTEQYSSNGASISREYDELVFCFTGSAAGEAVLGFKGVYLSGTYKIPTIEYMIIGVLLESDLKP